MCMGMHTHASMQRPEDMCVLLYHSLLYSFNPSNPFNPNTREAEVGDSL